MTDTDNAERDRRVQLAATTAPGDPITAFLVERLGTERTIRLAYEEDAPAPEGIPLEGFVTWQEQLTATTRTTTVTDALAACRRHDIAVTIPGDPDWPTALDDLSVPPLALFHRGDLSLLGGPLKQRIAVAGAKASTSYGEHITTEAVAELSREGHVIVAGAGHGIDAAALRAALAARGRPIAVMAGGLDRYYPAPNEELIRRVAQRGVVISEAPPGILPTRWRFLQRDRIIAAIAGTSIIVEAGPRSASLRIAQQARDLGRIVAAFPGPVTSTASAGPHLVIASGAAHLVTGAQDIHDLIERDPTGVLAQTSRRERPRPIPEERRARLRLITPERPEPPETPGSAPRL